MLSVSALYETLLGKGHIAPEFRATVFDTTKTVPSNGFNVGYYTFNQPSDLDNNAWETGSNVTVALTGSEFSTALAFDWGEGSPPPVSQVDNYGAIWDGWFFARYSGVYRFYIDSGEQCGARVKLDGSYLSFKDPDTDATGNPWYNGSYQGSTKELYADTASLTAGQWYQIRVEFYTGSNLFGASRAYFACKYREPTGATTSYNEFGSSIGITDYEADTSKKVLSAGVVNTTNSFLTGEVAVGVREYNLDRPFGSAAQTELEIDISPATQVDYTSTATGSAVTEMYVDSTNGFASSGVLKHGSTTVSYTSKTSVKFNLATGYDIHGEGDAMVQQADTAYAWDSNDNSIGPFKMFRLVKIEAGLNSGTGSTEYIERMWGIVSEDPEINIGEDGATAKIIIQDFSTYLQDYIRNYPDDASYSAASLYTGSGFDLGPNGRTRPVCYDGWSMDDAIRDLLIKGNVDPVWTYGRRRMAYGTDFNDSFSGPLIRGEDVTLDQKPLYGNPDNVDEDSADDEYVWFFKYGQSIYESIVEICNAFGYGFSFTEGGFARFEGMDVPINSIASRDYSTGAGSTVQIASPADWTKTADLYSVKAITMVGSISGSPIVFNVVGRYIDIAVSRDSAVGVGLVKIDGTPITSVYMDGSTQQVTGGLVDMSPTADFVSWSYYQGINPTTTFNHGFIRLDLGTFDSHAVSIAPSGGDTIKVGGCFVYDRLSIYAETALNTDNIEKLSDTISISELRNEVIVIGSLVGLFKDNRGNTVNPNNPISKHVSAAAVDLNSLYNATVKNYTGRRIPFEIYNPGIFSQSRADYMAIAVLDKYRQLQHSPDFSIAKPDPRIQLLDTVTINDDHYSITTSSDFLYVLGYNESIKATSDGLNVWTQDVKLSGHKPLLSFTSRPAPYVDEDFNGEAAINVTIKYGGKRIAGDDGEFTSTTTFEPATDPGWLTDQWAGHELWVDGYQFRFLITSNDSNTLNIHPGTSGDVTIALASGHTWGISYDPFDSDRGRPLEVHFDQLATGRVGVSISKIRETNDGAVHIAEINQAKITEVEEWGAGKVAYWDGIIEQTNYLTTSSERHFPKITINVSASKKWSVDTSLSNQNSQKSIVRPKILNAGLHVSVNPIDIHQKEDYEYVGHWNYGGVSGDYVYYEDAELSSHSQSFTGKRVDIPFPGWTSPTRQIKGRASTYNAIVLSHDTANARIFLDKTHLHPKAIYQQEGNGGTLWSSEPWLMMIIDDGASWGSMNFNVRHGGFRHSDNNGRGAKMRITTEKFYVKTDSHKKAIFERPGGAKPESYTDISDLHPNQWQQLGALEGLKAVYNDTEYALNWSLPATVLDHCSGDQQRAIPFAGKGRWGAFQGNFDGNDIGFYQAELMPLFYWSKHNPSDLKWSTQQMHQFGSTIFHEYNGDMSRTEMSKHNSQVRTSDAALEPVRQTFPNSRMGLFLIHAHWAKNYSTDLIPPTYDSPLALAHHHYYLSPEKCTPKSYGAITVQVAIERRTFRKHAGYQDLVDLGDNPLNVEWKELLNTGMINIENFDFYFSPVGVIYNGREVSSWKALIEEGNGSLDPEHSGYVRVHFKIDIRDRAGRPPASCKSGIHRQNGEPFDLYEDESIYYDLEFLPETAEGYNDTMTSGPANDYNIDRCFGPVYRTLTGDGYWYSGYSMNRRIIGRVKS